MFNNKGEKEREELMDKCFSYICLYKSELEKNVKKKYLIEGLKKDNIDKEKQIKELTIKNNNYEAYKTNYNKLHDEYNTFITKENEKIEELNKSINSKRIERVITLLERLFKDEKYVEIIETHTSIKSKVEKELPLNKKLFNKFIKDLENTTTLTGYWDGIYDSYYGASSDPHNNILTLNNKANYTSKEYAQFIIDKYKIELKELKQ